MKTITIKICKSNEAAKYEAKIQEVASKFTQVHIVIEECLNRCSFCEDMPYVLIQNRVEFGDDMNELYEAIEESLR